MKVKSLYTLPKILQKELGDDLVFSMVLDGDKMRLCVSTYKSKWNLLSGADIQTCQFEKEDMDLSVQQLAKKLVKMYREVLTLEKVETVDAIV